MWAAAGWGPIEKYVHKSKYSMALAPQYFHISKSAKMIKMPLIISSLIMVVR